jgi:hypothetical protein
MFRRFLAAVLLAAPGTILIGQAGPVGDLTPEVLYWRNGDGQPNRATGLLYRPSLLSALMAGRERKTVPSRIIQAVEQQTPIVVMWTIPAGPTQEERGPSRLVITDTTSGNTIAPIWETQDAGDLHLLDPRTSLQDVGAVAAFPLSAFQPGRVVVIHALLPDDPVTGSHRRVQVFGHLPILSAR